MGAINEAVAAYHGMIPPSSRLPPPPGMLPAGLGPSPYLHSFGRPPPSFGHPSVPPHLLGSFPPLSTWGPPPAAPGTFREPSGTFPGHEGHLPPIPLASFAASAAHSGLLPPRVQTYRAHASEATSRASSILTSSLESSRAPSRASTNATATAAAAIGSAAAGMWLAPQGGGANQSSAVAGAIPPSKAVPPDAPPSHRSASLPPAPPPAPAPAPAKLGARVDMPVPPLGLHRLGLASAPVVAPAASAIDAEAEEMGWPGLSDMEQESGSEPSPSDANPNESRQIA